MNKQELLNVLAQKQIRLAVAFIYLSDDLVAFSVIEERMKTALARIAEKILTIEKEEVVETVATAEAIAMGAEETQSVQEP